MGAGGPYIGCHSGGWVPHSCGLIAWVGIREANRYTFPMSLALDPATEQRIQRELARGPYREPSELINRALDLFDAQEDWLLRNKDAINERLEESFAQIERGEGVP